jgi:hypothetical protein
LIFKAIQKATIFISDTSARVYFPTLIRHAAANNSATGTEQAQEVLRDEVCLLLVQSLKTDKQCYQTWLEVYPRYIPHSNNLLLYIMINWKSVRNLV